MSTEGPKWSQKKEVVPRNLHNIVAGLVNCFLPENRQISFTGVKTYFIPRKPTDRELAEEIIGFFDEVGVVRYKGDSFF